MYFLWFSCLCQVLSVYRLRSEGVAVSVLHAGRELEVGDANVVVSAVQENVSLRGRGGAHERETVMRKCLRYASSGNQK